MTSLASTASKGEKSKAKFPSLNINNIFLESRGESSESQKQQRTANRKPGFQILGKISNARRPANLPSVKSEKNVNDNPSGATNAPGWSKQETATTVTTPAPQNQTTTQNVPTVSSVNVQQYAHSDKSWSSITSIGGEIIQPPPFQSTQFHHDFPSLSSSDSPPNTKVNTEPSLVQQGPSLRPQSEGFWASGGGQVKAPPQNNESKIQNNLTPTVLSMPPILSQTGQVSSQMRNIIPPFMCKNNYPISNSSNVTNSAVHSNFAASNMTNRRYSPISPQSQHTDNKNSASESIELVAKPILNQDELCKMDVMTRNTGWATRDEIDYNQKLSFSDDESEVPKKAEVIEKTIPISNSNSNNSTSAVTTQLSDSVEDDDIWDQRRIQQSKEIAAAAERAKKRKEDEEKRFLETKGNDVIQQSVQSVEIQQKPEKTNVQVNHNDVPKRNHVPELPPRLQKLQNSTKSFNQMKKFKENEVSKKTDSKIQNDYRSMTTKDVFSRNNVYESKTSMDDYAIFDCNDDYEPAETAVVANTGTQQWGHIDTSNKPWDYSPLAKKDKKIRPLINNRMGVTGSRDEKRQVPGPITRDKIEADFKNEKRELVSLKPSLNIFDRKTDSSTTTKKISSSLGDGTNKAVNHSKTTPAAISNTSSSLPVTTQSSLTNITTVKTSDTTSKVTAVAEATTSTVSTMTATATTTTTKRILDDGWTFASENKPNRSGSSNRNMDTHKSSESKSKPKSKDQEDHQSSHPSKRLERSHSDKRSNSGKNDGTSRYWDYGATYSQSYNSRGRRVMSSSTKKSSVYASGDYGYDYGYDYDFEYDYDDYDYDNRGRYHNSTSKSSSHKKFDSKSNTDNKIGGRPAKVSTKHDDVAKPSCGLTKPKLKEQEHIEKPEEIASNDKKVAKTVKDEELTTKSESKQSDSINKEFKKPLDDYNKSSHQNKSNQQQYGENKKGLVRKSKFDVGGGRQHDGEENWDDEDAQYDDRGYYDYYSTGSYRGVTSRNSDRKVSSTSSKSSSYKSSSLKQFDRTSNGRKDVLNSHKSDEIADQKSQRGGSNRTYSSMRSDREYGKSSTSARTYGENDGKPKFERQKSFGANSHISNGSSKYPKSNPERKHSKESGMGSTKLTGNSQTTSLTSTSSTITTTTTTVPPNAWSKPITSYLKLDSTSNSNQKSEQLTEKNLVLDGSTPPMNTIIFENKNFKSVTPQTGTSHPDQSKSKFVKNQSKSTEKTQSNSTGIPNKNDDHFENGMSFNKPFNDILSENLQKKELSSSSATLQLSMSFNKNEDTSDMKLGFGFESALSAANDEKSKNSVNAAMSSVQNELNKKIQSVKKVWDTNVLDQSSHPSVVQDNGNYKLSYDPNSTFTSTGASLDTTSDNSHDNFSSSTNIPNSTATNICKVKPTTQNSQTISQTQCQSQPQTQTQSQPLAAFNNASSNSNVVIPPNLMDTKISPPPQLLQMLNSGTVNLNQYSQQFNTNHHLGYQANMNNSAQFSGMSAISSPPALVLNSNQNGLYGPLQIDQTQNRSQFAQFTTPNSYNMGGQNATNPLCGSMASMYLTNPPSAAQPQDIYQSLASQYRITQNSGYGQPQQINNPTTVLISSTSNSLMSASVKQSSQPISAIGTKGNQSFQQSQQPQPQSQQPQPQPQQPPHMYMTAAFDSTGIPPSFLSNANVLQRNPMGAVQSNVMQSSLQGPANNFYSNSSGTQNAYFPQNANSALQNAANFGMQNNLFGPSQNFGSQFLPSMAQPFRTPTIPAQNNVYLKALNAELRSNLGQDPLSSYNSVVAAQHIQQSRNKPKPVNSPMSIQNKNFQNISSNLNSFPNNSRPANLAMNRADIAKYNTPIQRPINNYYNNSTYPTNNRNKHSQFSSDAQMENKTEELENVIQNVEIVAEDT